MVYHILFKDTPVADITTDDKNMVISIEKLVPDSMIQPFWGELSGKSRAYLTERFYWFLKDRCYEDSRANLQDILRQAGMTSNNPYEWIRVSHGVMYEDFFWVKIDDENVVWDDVKVRD